VGPGFVWRQARCEPPVAHARNGCPGIASRRRQRPAPLAGGRVGKEVRSAHTQWLPAPPGPWAVVNPRWARSGGSLARPLAQRGPSAAECSGGGSERCKREVKICLKELRAAGARLGVWREAAARVRARERRDGGAAGSSCP